MPEGRVSRRIMAPFRVTDCTLEPFGYTCNQPIARGQPVAVRSGEGLLT
jgi:hypothetical protein